MPGFYIWETISVKLLPPEVVGVFPELFTGKLKNPDLRYGVQGFAI
jgi:hypothetical protein